MLERESILETLAIVLFAITYIMLLLLPRYRPHIALTSAAAFIVVGIVPLNLVFGFIDWNVILMIAGTMGIVSLFIESRMPALLADLILEKTPSIRWAIVALSLFSGLISAFVDNVATVLIVAPVAMSIAKKQGISPVTSVIAVAIASNLQGAATLVGDATSILLGGHANLDFLDFFWLQGRPGMFWVVQAGAVAATVILYWVLRSTKGDVQPQERTKVEDRFPGYLLVFMVVLLILASFIPEKPAITNGLICTALFVVGLVRDLARGGGVNKTWKTILDIDFFTLLLLMGLFVVVGGLTQAGVIERFAAFIARTGQGNVFVIYTMIVWMSVIISGFVDNIPYVATMLPVVGGVASILGIEPNLLYFGLLCGATLGGNLTPIGASANITGIGLLRKEGYEVSAGQFMRLGIPFTLAAVITGYLLVWFLWS
ncbi:MAG TPA: TRAP transporter large permease subunit [Firmicutes bacterium]|jgi:Na+/H+ antiporter NhaD/arsenite permease-like protein|nr:SLC13 family permease [Bacillota bacterium]HHT43571.1 TRAP transporter large permease subunit [Bacillota bacterium]